MRLNLFKKLLLTFAAVVLVSVLVLAIWLNTALQRGFDRFRTNQIQPLLDLYAKEVATMAQEGSVDLATPIPGPEWNRQLLRWAVATGHDPRILKGLVSHQPRTRRAPPHGPRGIPNLGFGLFDSNHNRLAGNFNWHQHQLKAPVTTAGKTLAYVAYAPSNLPLNDIEKRFIHGQQRIIIVGAVVIMLLGSLAAWLLARHFSRPIVKLASATDRLANGDYDHRVDHRSSDELGDLTQRINHLAHALQNTDQSRQRWFAELTHELRTPVAVLRGEIEAMRDGFRRSDAAALASLLEEILRLQNLLNDLQTLSLADAGALEYHMSDVNGADSLQQCIESLERSAPENTKWQIDIEPDLPLFADQERIFQLWRILLTNALQHSDAPATISVQAKLRDQQVVVTVADSAPALDPLVQDTLFQSFVKGRSSNANGSGVGLAIAHKIAAAHQASIAVGASPLGGAKFTLHFPVSASA